jgi:uncharacterized membrane protein YfcA
MNQFLIVCPLLFLAGFLDAIGGGGGLISLPAYLLAGLPVHSAIATNKLSGSCGTALATIQFIRRGMVNWKLAIPTVAAAILGSSLGAKASMAVEEAVMEKLLLCVLPVAAVIVLRSRSFQNEGHIVLNRRTWATALLSAAVVGFYDGFYGPGTGTFLIIAFTTLAKFPLARANAHAKVINLTTNLTSLAVFLTGGQVVFLLGLAGAACNMAGNFLGAELAVKRGAAVTKPVILIVLGLLALKLLGFLS